MSVSLQVIYPASEGTSFDMDYYTSKHLPMVPDHIGAHIESAVVTKGVSGGPDTPAPYHAVATLVFADEEARNAAMAAIGPLVADIPNFTNVQPHLLFGDVAG